MTKRPFSTNRRRLLQAFAATAGAAAVGRWGLSPRRAHAADEAGPYFLIVLPAFGGGAIIDSFLPLTASEATTPDKLDCFPDDHLRAPLGTPMRAVNAQIGDSPLPGFAGNTEIPLSWFLAKHKNEMMVTTLEGTSVNHAIAQHRALTGNGAYNGRTMQECVALAYGEGMPLPNVNMASFGYIAPGDDPSLPEFAYAEPVPLPLFKPLSLSAYTGQVGAPDPELINLARGMRNERLDPQSSFHQAFRLSDRITRWKQQRAGVASNIESLALIDKLIFVEETSTLPLSDFGLSASPDAQMLTTVFPDMLSDPKALKMDFLEQQAALAFLMLKNGVSCTATISPSNDGVVGGPFGVKNPLLAFDGSHNDHRAAQALMWHRILTIADKLITLLKATPFGDAGESMWDRTMIHFATDFGRDKRRPSGQAAWGTAHHLNNGTLTVSPLVKGNSVLGGVFKKGDSTVEKEGYTYGFDLVTGAPDQNRTTTEAEHFSGILQALKVETPAGLPDVPAMRKSG